MLKDIQQTIGFLVVQICKGHRGYAEHLLNDIGLHAGQEMFLLYLWEQDGQTQTQIAEQMGIQPPTLHKMIARMESLELVERRPDDEDGRVSRVYLTTKSRLLKSEVASAWESLETRTTAHLTLDERILLRRLLMQVYQNLTDDL